MDNDAVVRQGRWTMGILNEPTTNEVPGSVLLMPKASEYNAPLGLQQMPARTSTSSLPASRPQSPSRRSSTCSKKRTVDGRFILDPQPTDSANDPLNWPVVRRDLALFSLGLYCMIGGGMTPVLAAGFNTVAVDFGVTIPQVALTTGLYMLGLGLGSVVLSPTAILYGKRPVYVAAALCFIVSNIWCAVSSNFASLVVARIFMGFAVSSVECLPSASIAEIYFLHEKAYRLGIYTLLLLGGKNLVPLVSAAIIQSLGWRWVFWIVAMTVAFAGVLLFLFVPETFWDRSPVPRGSRLTRVSIEKATPAADKSSLEDHDSSGAQEPYSINHYTHKMTARPPKSFGQQLSIYSGRLTQDKWIKVAARPFLLYLYPSILWSALVYSLSIGWLIVLSESVASIYENQESYNFTPLQVGLVYISPFVGGILGTAVAGKVSDIIVRFMARKNGGLYEPEFRLVMALPIATTTVIGLMGFGWSAAERDAWIVPTIFFGLISFGCSLGSTTSITFAVDSYRQYAGEALVTLNFSKNILHGLVWSLFFNRWLEADGSRNVFIAIGAIQLACVLTTVPMYIYGKRLRMWTVRKNFMEHL